MNTNTKRIPGRRVLKLALKEYSRTLQTFSLFPRYAAHMKARDAMNEVLARRGLYSVSPTYVAWCLHNTRLKNRVFNRLGRVALERNCLVNLDDLWARAFWKQDLRKAKFINKI
jgi:hypothetical protein